MFCAKAGSFVFHSFTFFVFVHFQLCQQHVLSSGLFSVQTLVMTTALHKDGLVGGGGGGVVYAFANSGDDHSIETGWWLFVCVCADSGYNHSII